MISCDSDRPLKPSTEWSADKLVILELDSDEAISTQCLAWEHPNILWQSSGHDEQSKLIKSLIHNPISNAISTSDASNMQQEDLAQQASLVQQAIWPVNDIFAEGCTPVDQWVLLLSWRSYSLHVINKSNGRQVGVWPLSTEGWGLSASEQGLIYSDGSSTIRWILPPSSWAQSNTDSVNPNHSELSSDTLALNIYKELNIYDQDRPIFQLNELEWVEDFIFANVFPSDKVAMIDSESGQVLAWLDLSSLAFVQKAQFRDQTRKQAGVSNGIAYDKTHDFIWLTGKHWSKLYGLRASSILDQLRVLKESASSQEKASLKLPSSSR